MDQTLYTKSSESLADPKRLKLSDDSIRMVRLRIAMFMGYCGAAYDCTRSTGKFTKTIKDELEKALYMAGAEDDKHIVLAQTNEDVSVTSAVGQVVSGRFYVDPQSFVQNVNACLPADIRIFGYKIVTKSFHAERSCDMMRYVYLIPVFALDPASHASGGEDECLECSRRGTRIASSFSYGEKENETFNKILKYYVGCYRYCKSDITTNIDSFQANAIVTLQGMEFVKCEIVGHRFTLLQIRKMMGLAVALMRGLAPNPELLICRRFKKPNFKGPTAPDVGLYLDECFFTYRDEVSMKPFKEEAEYFKMKHIFSHIGSTEHEEGIFALWLHTLNHCNYPNLNVKKNPNLHIWVPY
ncbi:hypothetical protein ACFE04_013736 [Oxalis oulophora]